MTLLAVAMTPTGCKITTSDDDTTDTTGDGDGDTATDDGDGDGDTTADDEITTGDGDGDTLTDTGDGDTTTTDGDTTTDGTTDTTDDTTDTAGDTTDGDTTDGGACDPADVDNCDEAGMAQQMACAEDCGGNPCAVAVCELECLQDGFDEAAGCFEAIPECAGEVARVQCMALCAETQAMCFDEANCDENAGCAEEYATCSEVC